ncbi:megakaryocyte and platelet inhibitory receptor G6b [Phyllostomus discolor]|uniref:Megakaryocyte and platelet inhibitory receptor G6b n=1 Tax=Phyllostomus discolor TaxID=89673 RepID=A0A7E6DKU0_9CHIR|nr:megakaryocyte and platelet inhibitory receptor G6b isoform X2 [Phyllostomus discolor]KAF6115076.1 megakaryocyte and platelet inhibitory receptor G6b [Phyllostomus discolor]
MALVLQLLPLLLSRAQGEGQVPLDGRPGDRVNLSCSGISHPIRWAWAPSFPTCKGLSKGRRPILWASSSGTPTVSPVHPFAGRLRVLDPGIRRLELLLSAGDSGTFICRGRHEEESRTVLKVMGDGADCRTPGPSQGSVYPQLLILLLLGAGLVLGLGGLGVVWWQRRRSSLHPLRPLPRFALSPPHSSTSKSRAPEASKGGGAQDHRGHGPGAEPAVCRPGSYGLQKTSPVVASGPC